MYLSGLPVSRAAFAGMQLGTVLTFAAQVKDAQGRTIASARPTLASKNPAVIALDADGSFRAVGRGSTWLTARYTTPTGVTMADSISAGLVCTTIAVAGINLTVSDSVTGAALATSLSISARSGTFADSAFAATQTLPVSLGMAYERPGTFEVRVRAAGYRDWAALGVVIGTDLCHVIPVQLSARLQRS
jgi:hypothetical protein